MRKREREQALMEEKQKEYDELAALAGGSLAAAAPDALERMAGTMVRVALLRGRLRAAGRLDLDVFKDGESVRKFLYPHVEMYDGWGDDNEGFERARAEYREAIAEIVAAGLADDEAKVLHLYENGVRPFLAVLNEPARAEEE